MTVTQDGYGRYSRRRPTISTCVRKIGLQTGFKNNRFINDNPTLSFVVNKIESEWTQSWGNDKTYQTVSL